MSDYCIIRYNEIALKGKNRFLFENKLIRNIKDCIKKNNIRYNKIIKVRGRILIETKATCNKLKTVFGIASISPAVRADLDLREIKEKALKLYKKGSFRISARRLTKIFLSSQEINEKIGEYIQKKRKAKVNLKKPKTEIGIEIINDEAYLFNKKIKGLNGLPVGITGLVSVLLENKEGLRSAYLMLKRGCKIELIKKKKIGTKILKRYSYGGNLKIVKKISKDSKAIIVSDKFPRIKKRDYKLQVLYPLLVYPEFEI